MKCKDSFLFPYGTPYRGCLIPLAIGNHRDCDFKFQNQSRDAKVIIRVQTENCLSL